MVSSYPTFTSILQVDGLSTGSLGFGASELVSLNNVNKTELINMIRKPALLIEQFEKLVIKNKFGYDIYDIIESFFLQKHNEKVLRTGVFCINNSKPKTVELKQDIWLIMTLVYFSLFTLLM